MKIREVRIVESRGNWASMLLEDRADYIATNLKAKLEAAAQRDTGQAMDSKAVVDELKKADPDPQGKNLQFLANMYVSGQFKMEDRERVKTDIEQFMKSRRGIAAKLKEPGNEELAGKYPNGVNDLLQLKSLNDLYDLVDLTGGAADVSGKEVARQEMQGANKVIDTPNFKVYIPQTQEAACRIGSGTRWCTAGDKNNMFSHYHSQGPLYIIMANVGGKLRKWQLHYESGQYMDERDQSISQADIAQLSKIPEYTDFLNCLIVKYYGKYLPPEETKGKCKYPV